MPTLLQTETDFPLPASDVAALWQATIRLRRFPDAHVTVRTVSQEEIQRLNTEFRNTPKPTNVLTFSYPAHKFLANGASHDVALCLAVAAREARARSVSKADYTALLLVHAFLHVSGLDHERSAEEAQATAAAEKNILTQCGFSPVSL